MLVEMLSLNPQMLKERGGGCGTRLLGAENSTGSVFVSFKSR